MNKYEGLDYTYNFYAGNNVRVEKEAPVEHHKQGYNPYMNNMGTVLGKKYLSHI
jgi:hypothetical protein